MISTQSLHYYPGLHARPAYRKTGLALAPVTLAHVTWPDLWREIQLRLRGHGYARNTVLFYRQIVRAFSRFVAKSPGTITASDLHAYLGMLGRNDCTWHWAAMNLSVLRTVFDKLCGLDALTHRRGPRRKKCIPEYLDRAEIVKLMDSATCLRDQLLIALIYGCGLKTNELRRLAWDDLSEDGATLRVASRWGRTDRQLAIPSAVRSLLLEGRRRCPGEEVIFTGPSGRKAMSARRIQVVVKDVARKAGIQKAVLPVTLRHSYAVHFLQDGGTIRQLQENLDHRLLETTARYLEITGLPEMIEPAPLSPPGLPIAQSFWQQLTDRFTRRVKGIRIFKSSA